MLYLDASRGYYRFVLLFFNTLIIFGAQFCYDMPSVIQGVLQAPKYCNTTADDYIVGFGLTFEEYNLLYAVYSWANAAMSIIAGYLLDRLGNGFGVFVFSTFCFLGTLLFSVGAMLRDTWAMLPLMLIGRFMLGCGLGSLYATQCRINYLWFFDKELGLSVGIIVSYSRLGNVVNFIFTKYFVNEYGLMWTMWFSVCLVILSMMCAVITRFLDVYGIRQLGKEISMKSESSNVTIRDMLNFTDLFWLIAVCVTLFQNIVFGFVADGSEYIKEKHDFEETSEIPSHYVSMVYISPLVMAPFFGILIDRIGKRSVILLFAGLLTNIAFTFLVLTKVTALLSTSLIGICYSLVMTCIWSSIPLVVPSANLGIALGLLSSIPLISIGISNVIIGAILEYHKYDILNGWKLVMIYFLSLSILLTVCSTIVLLLDWKKGGKLYKTKMVSSIQEFSSLNETLPLTSSFLSSEPIEQITGKFCQ